MPPFFDIPIPPNVVADPGYTFNREHENRADFRAAIEIMWREYEPHCPDENFPAKAITHFQGTLWQMHVAVELMRRGIELLPVRDHGPDILFRNRGVTCAVEAVAAQPGTGPDAVPDPPRDQVYHPNTEDVILRLRSALSSKIQQHQRWLRDGVIDQGMPLIVAISAGEIPDALIFPDLSHMEKALFPLDDGAFHVVPGTDRSEFRYGFRSGLTKRNGSVIRTDAFLTNEADHVSAVLYSPHHVLNSCNWGGTDFRLIFNPNAVNLLPRGILNGGQEIWVEDGRLHREESPIIRPN